MRVVEFIVIAVLGFEVDELKMLIVEFHEIPLQLLLGYLVLCHIEPKLVSDRCCAQVSMHSQKENRVDLRRQRD